MNLTRAKWFTKLDIHGAYNLIQMAQGEEWKTTFRTQYGLFESLVMPFGLTNAPATFQNFINDILAPYLDRFCTAYLDDTLIYCDTFGEHQEHINWVLEAFEKAGLHLKLEKYEFHCQEVKYLGLIISMEGIKMDPEKITAVQDWEVLQWAGDMLLASATTTASLWIFGIMVATCYAVMKWLGLGQGLDTLLAMDRDYL
jgi:hypothetical protein